MVNVLQDSWFNRKNLETKNLFLLIVDHWLESFFLKDWHFLDMYLKLETKIKKYPNNVMAEYGLSAGLRPRSKPFRAPVVLLRSLLDKYFTGKVLKPLIHFAVD